MKNIFLSMAVLGVALGFSSCSETWDDNPVLKTHEGVVEANFLNEPAMQEQSIMLTSDNQNGSFLLTCSQPDFGYAAIATYKVQCSLTPEFTEYQEITQPFYNCAQIKPTNGDVAKALENLSGVQLEEDLPLPYQTLYMRLRAYIAQDEANTQYISNVVSFKSVSANYLAIWVADVPVNIYIRGGMNDWGTGASWQFSTGTEENTWILANAIIQANVSFKIAADPWDVLNLGGNDGENENSQMVDIGDKIELTAGDNPGHLRLKEDFSGNVVLSLDNGKYYVIFDPAQ